MINAIYGTKVGMTQLFDEDGTVIPVTVRNRSNVLDQVMSMEICKRNCATN